MTSPAHDISEALLLDVLDVIVRQYGSARVRAALATIDRRPQRPLRKRRHLSPEEAARRAREQVPEIPEPDDVVRAWARRGPRR